MRSWGEESRKNPQQMVRDCSTYCKNMEMSRSAQEIFRRKERTLIATGKSSSRARRSKCWKLVRNLKNAAMPEFWCKNQMNQIHCVWKHHFLGDETKGKRKIETKHGSLWSTVGRSDRWYLALLSQFKIVSVKVVWEEGVEVEKEVDKEVEKEVEDDTV